MKKRLLPLLVCLALLCGLFSGCMGGGEDAEPSAVVTAPVQSAAAAASPEPTPAPDLKNGGAGETVSPAPATRAPTQEPQQTDGAPRCTVSIECSTLLSNLDSLASEKRALVPADGVILGEVSVELNEGDTVYDVLRRVCSENNIRLEASFTAAYNSAYIEGIANLYQLDCGTRSGWMYRVNGVYPNCGCSGYTLSSGDVIEWRYTCDLGYDIGGGGRA